MVNITQQQVADFQAIVMDFYQDYGRHDLPWRRPETDGSFDPYKILVSELMLQQTQVMRVIPKFNDFIEQFPSVEALAESSLATVLTAWSGLGYNRRAKFLHQAAKYVVHTCGGVFPGQIEELIRLPGVGKNTAGAILAYTYNQPALFVETNIRTVYFYHFFQGREVVNDSEIIELLEKTLFKPNPRAWFWALMDYGSHLKSSGVKLNTLSKHYTKQSKFEGSKRQIRGQVIRELAVRDLKSAELVHLIPDSRLVETLADLIHEGLVTKTGSNYHLSK